MQAVSELLASIWSVYLDTAVWLLLGLVVAGLIKGYIPEARMSAWLGDGGAGAPLRAALVGAPLPLCSCGVLPVALGLRRNGASRGATVSFLISTPETSVDSITVTYALMGPLMAVVRPVAALATALLTGLAAALVPERAAARPGPEPEGAGCCGAGAAEATGDTAGCCGAAPGPEACGSGSSEEKTAETREPGWKRGIGYTLSTMLDDIAGWLALGIVVAGLVAYLVPPGALAEWGGGPWAMLAMLVVGIPMYVCATASTPLAAAMMLAGVSPGAALVFLLVGPATNFAGLAIIGRELGRRTLAVYLAGLAVTSVVLGLALDAVLAATGLGISVAEAREHAMLPAWISWPAALVLLVLAIRPVRRRLAGSR